MKSTKSGFSPTPPEVKEAVKVIAAYLRENGWVEAVISDSGGAAFFLETVLDRPNKTEVNENENTERD